MNDRRFDALTRSLGGSTNRRQLLRGAAGLLVAVTGLRAAGADAARRGYGGPGQTNNYSPTVEITGVHHDDLGEYCLVRAVIRNAPPTTFAYLNFDSTNPRYFHDQVAFNTKADGSAIVTSKYGVYNPSVVTVTADIDGTPLYYYDVVRCR